MLVWIILAAMTALAVLAVLGPLARAAGPSVADSSDKTFYRTQIAEIERDRARGLISEADAEIARAEAARRLLRASGGGKTSPDAAAAVARRRLAAIVAIAAVPAIALPLYGMVGNPSLPDLPLAPRRAAAERIAALPPAEAMAEATKVLARDAGNGPVAEIAGPLYLRANRIPEAVRAFAVAVDTLGANAKRLTDLGIALSVASDGRDPKARELFERALTQDKDYHLARFFLATTLAESGEFARARAMFEELLAVVPPDSPVRNVVRRQITELEKQLAAVPKGGEGIVALPAEDRRAAIRSMVAGLASRLADQGGTPEEWGRLVRSYGVLEEKEKARTALADARKAFAADAAKLAAFEALVATLELDKAPP